MDAHKLLPSKYPKEVKGMGLAFLFDSLDPECEKADITYACPDYETWGLTDDLYEELMNMTGKKLRSFLDEDSWIELNGKIYKGMEK